MEQEGGFFRRLLCKYNRHVFVSRHKSGVFMYGSYGTNNCGEVMCFWCKAYYVDGKKIADNFYKD